MRAPAWGTSLGLALLAAYACTFPGYRLAESTPADGAGQGGEAAPGPSGQGGESGEGGESGKGTLGGGGAAGATPVAEAGQGGVPAREVCARERAPETNCVCHTHEDHDYWFCLIPRNFADAEQHCTAQGMHLARISSAAEDGWVYDTSRPLSFGDYYLGASDFETQDSWSWRAGGELWQGRANGSALGYSNWNGGEPNGSGDCLIMLNGLVWDDNNCADSRRYVCEDGGSAVPEPFSCGTSTLESCACVNHQGRDYVNCWRDRSWEVSRSFCESMGMQLLRIDDAAEDAWALGVANGASYWLAGKEVATGEWRWQAGSDDLFWNGDAAGMAPDGAFTHWGADEPNGTALECLGIFAGAWDDAACDDRRKMICEPP